MVDVRNPGEVRPARFPGPCTSRSPSCPPRLAEIPRTGRSSSYCAGGYRSSVAASLLRRAGFADVSDLLGGYGAWLSLAQPVGERVARNRSSAVDVAAEIDAAVARPRG